MDTKMNSFSRHFESLLKDDGNIKDNLNSNKTSIHTTEIPTPDLIDITNVTHCNTPALKKKTKTKKFIMLNEENNKTNTKPKMQETYECQLCKGRMIPSTNASYECSLCGYIKNMVIISGYNDISHTSNSLNNTQELCITNGNKDDFYTDKCFTESGMATRVAIIEELNRYNFNSKTIKFDKNVLDIAAEISFRVLFDECHRSLPRKGILSAALKLACNQVDISISRLDEEYIKYTGTTNKFMTQGIKDIENKLNICFSQVISKKTEADNFIERYIDLLKLNPIYKDNVITLINLVKTSGRFDGQTEVTIWLGSLCIIYKDMDGDTTVKKNITSYTKITPSTLNSFINKVGKYRNEFIEAFIRDME